MLRLICILGLVGASFAIVDMDCVGADGNFTAEAVACEDIGDSCADYYPTKVSAGNNTERAPFCFSADNATVIDKEMKDAAVKDCPKTCGYCCLSPAWNCKNPEGGTPKCSTVTPKMCKDPLWKDLITKNCPNKCGFCTADANTCVDEDPEFCAKTEGICTNIHLMDLGMKLCASTCKNCDGSKTKTTPKAPVVVTENPNCKDQNSTVCAKWEAYNYCASPDYSTASKKLRCAKTCNLC